MVGHGVRLRRAALPGERVHHRQKRVENGILYKMTSAKQWAVAEHMLKDGWRVLQDGEWLPWGQATRPCHGGSRKATATGQVCKKPATKQAFNKDKS